MQHTAGIAPVEGIEHRAVPDIQSILQRKSQQGDDDDDARQAPRDASPTAAPEAQGCFPEACEEILPGLSIGVRTHRWSRDTPPNFPYCSSMTSDFPVDCPDPLSYDETWEEYVPLPGGQPGYSLVVDGQFKLLEVNARPIDHA